MTRQPIPPGKFSFPENALTLPLAMTIAAAPIGGRIGLIWRGFNDHRAAVDAVIASDESRSCESRLVANTTSPATRQPGKIIPVPLQLPFQPDPRRGNRSRSGHCLHRPSERSRVPGTVPDAAAAPDQRPRPAKSGPKPT